ncbi:GNAT family N-acetyltransferase [Streptomyces indiaensis]|uniref:N-acetyltransferase domain-containing protein n=1 Tax=Streptomyces indiaensis TaxID=284033 RepID=A0ABP5QEG6_9ACTN|nr:GNAT family N-acetyltransferase [Streptomyces indiaensis]MCF1647092.1 GNAT family N-acetyltransferase [Streptomyces indiaensis]
MSTAMPRPATLPHALLTPAPPVRTARPDEAAALAALSRPFVRSGALRDRPVSLYTARAADFLVLEAADGTLDGCVGLRAYPGDEGREACERPGVVYNFCVAAHRQGSGAGASLLRAVLATARAHSLDALFTATTGSAGLFLRHGFTHTTARQAPRIWADSLDPRRDAQVLMRTW